MFLRPRRESRVRDEDLCRVRLYGPAPYGRLLVFGAIGFTTDYAKSAGAATNGPAHEPQEIPRG